jgi:hypothetical protein
MLNANADGAAKMIVVPGATRLGARADLRPGDDGAVPAARLDAAGDDLRRLAATAARRANGEPGGSDDGLRESGEPPAPVTGSVSRESAPDFAALLAETSWTCAPRASGRVAVDLWIPDRFRQAFVWTDPAGRPRLRARLAVLPAPTADTRRAVGVLLLTLSAVVRLVRAGVTEDSSGEATLCVDAPLGPDLTAKELDTALAATALAVRMTAREACALSRAGVAQAYLAARGWAASHGKGATT